MKTHIINVVYVHGNKNIYLSLKDWNDTFIFSLHYFSPIIIPSVFFHLSITSLFSFFSSYMERHFPFIFPWFLTFNSSFLTWSGPLLSFLSLHSPFHPFPFHSSFHNFYPFILVLLPGTALYFHFSPLIFHSFSFLSIHLFTTSLPSSSSLPFPFNSL